MIRLVAGLAALALAVSLGACATPKPPSGPYARDVPADAPPDTVGILFSWTPSETIVNFRNIDHIFPTHTVRHGDFVRPLPRAEVQIDPVVAPVTVKGEGAAMSLEQLMLTARMTGVIAVKDGKIVLERYAYGRSPDDRWTAMSVTKIFTSTLIGAAVKDGLIGSIDDPVVKYIPELKGSAYDGVTIRHLMNMSTGVRWNEDYLNLPSDISLAGGGPVVNGVPPLVAYAAKLDRAAEPGARYEYQNINADMAGFVLARALKGRSTADYLSEKIWKPYGMEADATWLVEKTGVERGGAILSMVLRDYARFGLFILDGARAGGADILPTGWLSEAWRVQPPDPGEFVEGHGFYWQVRKDGGYEGVGAYGQSLTVYPKENLVIAVNSAGEDPRGIGVARWDLIAAIRAALP